MATTLLKRAGKSGNKFLNPVPTPVGDLGLIIKMIPLYLSNKEERVPKRPLGPFRTDPSLYAQPPESGLRVTWMGHSSTLLELDGLRILIDPVWDVRASPVRWAGPRRFFEAPLKLADLPKIDVILISHDHYDHLGKSTIRSLAAMQSMSETRWVTSLGVAKILKSFGVSGEQITELDWTQSTLVRKADTELPPNELLITALPVRHFSGRSLSNRFKTLWSSFVLKGPKHAVYFGADSGTWDGFPEIGATYGPFDLTMLEIGGFNELWKQIHMGPDGAGHVFTAMGAAGLLLPIHWGLFDLALHAWRWPIERMLEVADELNIKLWSPTPGVPTEVVLNQELRSDWWR
jgi:L-ascorbate metabolism protein UlaG (beta-lactamase superfamily)